MLLLVWMGRNNRHHGKAVWSPYAAAKFVTKMVEDVWQIYQKENKKARLSVKWQPPDDGVLKLNTNAAFDASKCTGGTGAVLRNSRGILLRAQARWYDQVEDVYQAEAVAIRDGMTMAKQVGTTKLVVESDNVTVINMMNTNEDHALTTSSTLQGTREPSAPD
ncbi:hypothetical protein PR202_ga10655 [Eleusine coracana subsp. coracana]|uniref:RNase H type-1 domain-containing protein n=1 Tax=Eleusine coracana subsp. coracana TaxID=191504 RepID=A0AAV5C776_ELECO|nr:hypothetical protein PR202_ga10655 [Eleusine coracana subsp. coracana]